MKVKERKIKMKFQKLVAAGMLVAGIACVSITAKLIAGTVASTAPIITYTAAGTFGSTPLSGTDTLKLAGEPFSVGITVSASTPPYQNGPNWAAYHQLKFSGSVHSGLLGPTPVNIASTQASIVQAINPGQYDLFEMLAPVKVVGISLTIQAPIAMPIGTIPNQLLHPFNTVQLAPGNATVSYSDGTNVTVLPVQSGTLSATVPTGGSSPVK